MGRRSQLPHCEKEQPSERDSDTSGVSFRPGSDGSESDKSSTSTDLTVPDPQRSRHHGRRSHGPQNTTRNWPRPDFLPDFSDDPNDDTDEDLAAIPLDYGRSDKTKRRGTRIEQRWHKYCCVKALERHTHPKWNDADEALRHSTPSDIHRFLNYCLKLKYGHGGRHLKGTKKASSLHADWKSFRGYYRKITRNKINPEDSEEVNAGIRSLIDKFELDTQERDIASHLLICVPVVGLSKLRLTTSLVAIIIRLTK